MKKIVMKKYAIASALLLLFISTATFAGTQDCSTRINAIQTQIQYARQHGNVNQQAGLERALANVRASCTNAGQIERAERAERDVQQKQEDVRKAQAEVTEATDKLRDAQNRGDAKKTKRAQAKLADKQNKLREKMDKLRIAQADLAGLKS
ncbi:MAG: DUF1090 domain-containing protein [Paraburkholderia sp.]|nr:DUF1090 domain-containing protein [Paraburkholderia sp.]